MLFPVQFVSVEECGACRSGGVDILFFKNGVIMLLDVRGFMSETM